MFVDFNKVFAKTPQTEMAIPDALANQLSTKLPCGLKYEVDETGHYVVIVPDNDTKETIKFSGMQFIPTDAQKQVLGENYSFDDLLELSYNSQTPIPFELVNDGVVNINGTDISIDKLYYNPYFPKKIEVNSMVMFPAPLDEKFSITIGSETLSTEILVTRIPNFSIKTKEYETIQEKCLYVRYTWDSNTNKFLFTIKVRIDKAESVNEILKSMIIYNAFLDGKGYIAGSAIHSKLVTKEDSKYDRDALIFWEKVRKIETIFDISFSPPFVNFDMDTVYLVETLYQSLEMHNPVRKNAAINTIDSQWDESKDKIAAQNIGKQIYFEYIDENTFEIFGKSIKLLCLVGVFNAVFADYHTKENECTIVLTSKSEEQPMYISELYFKTTDEIEKYRETHPDRINILKKAKKIYEYLDDGEGTDE